MFAQDFLNIQPIHQTRLMPFTCGQPPAGEDNDGLILLGVGRCNKHRQQNTATQAVKSATGPVAVVPEDADTGKMLFLESSHRALSWYSAFQENQVSLDYVHYIN